MVCACEDVTLADIEQAVEEGYSDIESVKRLTGFGTGSCQARSCQHQVARILASLGADPESLQPITARPPLSLVSLGALADLHRDEAAASTPELRLPPRPEDAKLGDPGKSEAGDASDEGAIP